MQKKYIVLSYDVVNDRKRTLLAKRLLNYGRRVQKSVFECLITEKQFLTMKDEIEKIIDMNSDSVRYYTLCKGCVGIITVSGWGTVSESDEVIVI